MKLKVLGSSSNGNCYLLTDDNDKTLIIEAGIEYHKIAQALNWHDNNIAGAIVSHVHGDHAKYIQQFIDAGVDVYASPHVWETKKIKSVFAHSIIECASIGNFTIRAIPVEHDVPCFAFFIRNSGKSIFFITDAMYSRYRLPDRLNLAMIEANYDDETLTYNIENGITDAAMCPRLEHSHMAIHNSIEVIKSAKHIDNVVLMHLSSHNSSPDSYVEMVQKATAFPTYIAKKGLELTF